MTHNRQREHGERRRDAYRARVVDAALQLDAHWGCVSAWHYLLRRGVPRAIAMRVLSKTGPRREADSVHPAVRDALARVPEVGIAQRAASETPASEHVRTNVAAAWAVERAIDHAATQGRYYAESLLRMYALDTATVMRVLNEPHRRRRRHPPRQPP
ncbi:hypothetical protein [Pseudoduganella armeniaca]|uniref:Uncharacterized protein n=1 Tax=Pseudoduganella armeniaca TaxID=2072590 RepID=A0A2R4C990_9BURK|nr:hypothetical protein [Pseudoduganella armeniaca]AVR96151.1 hypothetical protein C9I28_10795 [Pseudoduganella armeniaca]